MTQPGKLTLRLAILGGVIIYLAGALWLWHGPLRRQLDRANRRDSQVVARVFEHPVTRSQLDRAISENLWLTGKSIESLTPENRKLARDAALDTLIDHELLRVKATTSAPQLTVNDAEINELLDRFLSRFESPSALQSAMKSQGIARKQDLRDRLAAHIQQEKYVTSKIAPLAKVSAEEARQWFDENRSYLTIPERVEVRHIFIPTLDQAPETAKAKLAAALADLTAKSKDFTTLARELSEDPATKDRGGSLGWMTRDRLPADFAAPVFSLALRKPTLVRSRLGWELVEVTDRKPAEPETFEQAKPEILAALDAVKRRQAVTEFRNTLRKLEASHIKVYQDLMGE